MPKGTHRSSKIETGITQLGEFGTAVESDSINRKGKRKPLSPGRAQALVGDSGTKEHKAKVEAAAKKLKKNTPKDEAAHTKVTTSSDDDFVKDSLKKAAKSGVKRDSYK